MTSKLYVYSTLTADQLYTNWSKGGADLPVAAGSVFIKGGAGVANDRIQTPRGVRTEITAEQAAILKGNTDFQLHHSNGFVEVSEEAVDPEQAAADMASRDGGAPIVPQDLTEGEQPKILGEDGKLEPLPPAGDGFVPPTATKKKR